MEQRASLPRHGLGRRFLPAHGGNPSQVAHPGVQPDRTVNLGRRFYAQRTYDQLYTYVIYGMVLSYTLTVIALFILRWKRPDIPRPYRCVGYPWLPAIYASWHRLDVEHANHAPDRSFLGDNNCADRGAGIFVLEAK